MAQVQSGMPLPTEGGAGTSQVFKQMSHMAALREGTSASSVGMSPFDGIRVGRHEQACQEHHTGT